MAYTKLFNSIVTSTIWLETDRTRIVWITMLALADQNGEVQASIPGLAHVAGVPVEDCRTALAKFLGPDLDSRTKDDDGRRIEEIDGGWSLINHGKYRAMCSKDEAKAAEAERKARYRARLSRNVPDRSQGVPEKAHIAEAPSEALSEENRERAEATPHSHVEASRQSDPKTPNLAAWQAHAAAAHPGWPADDVESSWRHYQSLGWRKGSTAIADWRECAAKCFGLWAKKSASGATPEAPARVGKNLQ